MTDNNELFRQLVNRMEATNLRSSRHESYLGVVTCVWGEKDGIITGVWRLEHPDHPVSAFRDVVQGLDFEPDSDSDACEAALLLHAEKFALAVREIKDEGQLLNG